MEKLWYNMFEACIPASLNLTLTNYQPLLTNKSIKKKRMKNKTI